jgi:hypothetical protein
MGLGLGKISNEDDDVDMMRLYSEVGAVLGLLERF